jgi:hypothetical protein
MKRVPRRRPNPEFKPIGYESIPDLKIKDKAMDRLAKQFLDRAGELFTACDLMDTAVRDEVCTGLAYLVHAGYDSQACALDISQFHEFVNKKTREWFESRGFADWFCEGAACGFNSSKPRILQFTTVRKSRRGVRTMKAVEVA